MNTVHIKHSIGVVLAGIFAITVIACAEYKVKENREAEHIDASVADESKAPEQDNSPAAPQYSSAEAAAVIAEAQMASKRAEELGGLWRDTTKLLKKANAALKKNNNDKAYEVATMAKGQAELALNQSYLEKANHMIGRVKKMAKHNDMQMLDRVSEAEAAYLSDNGEKAYAMSMAMLEQLEYPDRAKPVNVAAIVKKSRPKPIKPAQEKPVLFESLPDVVDQDHDIVMEKMIVMQMSSDRTPSAVNVSEASSNKMDLDDKYKVKAGDSLWIISSLSAVYSNPYQWPLIYKTNKKTIRDPDLIRPGLVLNIDREASEVEINAAITHAKSRGAWSLDEREVFDRAYLSDSDIATQ